MKLCLTAATFALLPVAALAQSPRTVESNIVNNKGETIGKVMIRGMDDSTVVRLAVNAGGLAPGWHGMHFHAVGDCSDTAKFEASKGHVNHGDDKHGLLNPGGPDDGDLPNIYAAQDGSVNAEVWTDTDLADDDKALLDRDGSALVIHANEDDHATQPIGGAGGRVACAVIKK